MDPMTDPLVPLLRVCDAVDDPARQLAERTRRFYQDQGVPLNEGTLAVAVAHTLNLTAVSHEPPRGTFEQGYWLVWRQFGRSFFFSALGLGIGLLGFFMGVNVQRSLDHRVAPTGWTMTMNISGLPPASCRQLVASYQQIQESVMVDGQPATPEACYHAHLLTTTAQP
jgi:hypothetical protein